MLALMFVVLLHSNRIREVEMYHGAQDTTTGPLIFTPRAAAVAGAWDAPRVTAPAQPLRKRP